MKDFQIRKTIALNKRELRLDGSQGGWKKERGTAEGALYIRAPSPRGSKNGERQYGPEMRARRSEIRTVAPPDLRASQPDLKAIFRPSESDILDPDGCARPLLMPGLSLVLPGRR